MKIFSIRSLIATTILVAGSFAATAHAQTTTKAVAVVPFMFEYNGHTFAAGQYLLTIRPDGVVEIGRSKHVKTGLAQNEPLDATASASTIVFHRAGGKYFLRQISTAGSNHTLNFMESKDEKKALSYDVADATPASNITVATEAKK